MSFDLRRRRRPGATGNPFASFVGREEPPFARKGLCFLQHDMDVANASGATVRADINNALEALATESSGATEPSTTYAYQFWADTTAGLLKQRNAANTDWEVRDTLAETLAVSRSSNTILAAGDHKKFFVATASFTQTLTAAATLGDGWWVLYRVNSGSTLTVDPNSSETIDGATTKAFVGPASGILFCNGSNFLSYGFDVPAASDSVAGVIEIATQAEQETGTDVVRAVTPGRQQFHPSAAKGWVQFNNAGSVGASYNVSSVTDNAAGNWTVNWDTDFSGTDYSVAWMVGSNGSSMQNHICSVGARAVGTTQLFNSNTTGTAADGAAGANYCQAWGDQ